MRPIVLARIGIVGCAAASLLRFIQFSTSPRPEMLDDAYMFLRYAKHFLSGHGFSWNAGDGPAYGPTSALYLIATTIARGVTSLTDAGVLVALPTAAGLLACAVLVLLGFLFLRDGVVRRSWLPLAVVPFLVLSSLFQYHSRTGMETMLSLLCNALVAVSVVAFTRNQTRARFALCLLAGYLSYLARPDNGATALLVPPLFFAASDRRLRSASAAYVVLFAAVIVVDLFVKTRWFGDAIPLSFFAKRHGFYAGYLGAYRWNAADYALRFMAECLPWLALVIAFADVGTAPLIGAALAPVAITFGYYLSVTQIMGFGARYYFPFLPFVMMAAFAAIRGSGPDWAERLAKLRATWGRRALLIAALLLLTVSPTRDLAARGWQKYVVRTPVRFVAHQRYVTPMAPPLPYVASWRTIRNITTILEEAPPDTVVAASEYGYLGSTLTHLTIVDVLGLNDRRIAQEGFSAAYLFSRDPDLIWFPHQDYSRMIAEMLDSPAFAKYEYYPSAFEYGLALNTHSPRFDSIRRIVERGFARVYEGRSLADYQGRPVHLANRAR